MSDVPKLVCPACTRKLQDAGRGLASCARCRRVYRRRRGLLDLRVTRRGEPAPDPVPAADLERAIAAMQKGVGFKRALEDLLLGLEVETADRTMLLLREARGAWFTLLRSRRGRALFLGNALSGTPVALLHHGFDPVLYELSSARLAFGRLRLEALAAGRSRAFVGGDGLALPFEDGAFELVVLENGLPGRATGWGHDLDECRRVCAGELVLIGDNRLAYKRSSGRRGDFRVPGPLQFARAALAPARGERTLAGYRRALSAPGFEAPRAFALYPHAREFTFLVGLDQERPRLAVGPKERENRLKLVGQRAGLFPLLTPSFALIAERTGARAAEGEGASGRSGHHRPHPPGHDRAGASTVATGLEKTRWQALLEGLAEATGEPARPLDQLVVTRGNGLILLTELAAGSGAAPDRGSEAGAWCVHVPLSHHERLQLERHHRLLTLVRQRFPRVPVPQPLFAGRIDGTYAVCERRLGGLTAPQLTGDQNATRRLLEDLVRVLPELVVAPPRTFDEAAFEELVAAKLELVACFAEEPSTLEALERLRDEAHGLLVGRTIPRVLYHADLRSKHLQVQRDGRLVGILDWGSSNDADLPYFDLLHFIVHERKHEAQSSAAAAWRLALGRKGLRDYEREALTLYARRLDLAPEVCNAIERLYPVLVAAMAESNWDYSRPRWLHRQFEV